MSLPSTQNKRKRAPAACTLCRKRHVRCNWTDMPSPCKRCTERKLKCVYEPVVPPTAQSVSPVMPRATPTTPSVHSPYPAAAVPHRPRAISDSVWHSSLGPTYHIIPEQRMGKHQSPEAWHNPSPIWLSPINYPSYQLHNSYASPENAPRTPLSTTHLPSYNSGFAVPQADNVYQSSLSDSRWFGSPYSGSSHSPYSAGPYHSHSHSPAQSGDENLDLDPPSRF